MKQNPVLRQQEENDDSDSIDEHTEIYFEKISDGQNAKLGDKTPMQYRGYCEVYKNYKKSI